MGEPIIKRGKRGDYTVIQNSALRDKRLSLKTKGLFCVMISLPDDWDYSISGLAAYLDVGRDCIRSGIKELKDSGYLLQEQSHDNSGKFAASVYVLQESAPPLSGFPTTVFPTTVFPTSDNTTQTKERLTKERLTNPHTPTGGLSGIAPKWKPERFDDFWRYYRTHVRGENRSGAVKAWDKLRPDDDLITEIARSLVKLGKTEAWKHGIGKPYASTFLNGRKWQDADDVCIESEEAGGWAEDTEVI